MLINQDNMRDMAADFLEHRGLIFLAGILTLLGGLAIVLTHNVWVCGWPVDHHHLRLAVGRRRRLPHDLPRQCQNRWAQRMLQKREMLTGIGVVKA